MKLPSPLHSNLWTLLLIFYSTHNGGRYMTKLTQVPTLMLALIRNLIVVILHTRLNIPSVSAWWATLPPAIAAKLSELKIWSVFFLPTTLQDLATSREGEKKKKKPLFLSAFSDQPLPAFPAASSTFPWYTHTKFVAIQWTWHTKFLSFS